MAYNPNQDALEALKRLQQGIYTDVPGSAFTQPESNDPSTQLYGLQEQREDELARNLEKARTSGGRFGTGGTYADLGSLQQDMAENPIPQAIAGLRSAEAAGRQAELEGFESPQEAAGWARDLETQKVGSPLAVANATGSAGLMQQRMQGQGALAVEEERGQNALELQDKFNQLQGFLNPGDSISTKAGSYRRAPTVQVPTQLVTAYGNAIKGTQAKAPGAAEQASYLAEQIFQRDQTIEPNLKAAAQAVMSRADKAGLPFDQLTPLFFDTATQTPASQEELAQLRRAIAMLRGSDF